VQGVNRFGAGGRMFAVFAALSLVPVLALGALLAIESRHQAQQRGIAEGRAQAEVIARLLGETQLAGHSLRTPLTDAEKRRLKAFATSEVASGSVTRLRLRAPDQHVVFSSDRTPSDRTDDEAAEAARGESVASISHLDTDEGDGAATGARSVEVYTPLRNPASHTVIGVLEVYLPYAPIAADLQAGLRRLYLALGVGLFLLYLLLAGLSAWTTSRLSRQSDRYQHLATHDPLTDLPNRAQFAGTLAATASAIRADGGSAAVVFVDLARFREVNETLGHRNGDLLLGTVAGRLRAGVRPVDTVARIGGDEFGLVLPGVGDPATLLAALAGVRARLEEEINLQGLPLNVQTSLGAAFIPKDGEDPDLLIQRGDIALNAAKRNHTGDVVCFDRGLDQFKSERLALVAELRRAIQRDELVMHYQPQVDQRSGSVHTLEALVRWQHPGRGLLPPDTFVPIAEQTGLVDDLTAWVLRAVLEQLREWRQQRPNLTVAVNISARSLEHPHLPQLVRDSLERTAADPDWLLLEITETALVNDAAHAAAVLQQLSDAGLRLSLDDFGQGYTSLSQLGKLPLSELKIDKSFVLNMLRGPGDAVIVRSVIDLAHNLGLEVVAEGVEDAEILAALRALGCDLTQGYYFSRPLPADQVPGWLAAFEQQDVTAGA
jgi:diguanylate cyclase (GGDEF)-like protein